MSPTILRFTVRLGRSLLSEDPVPQFLTDFPAGAAAGRVHRHRLPVAGNLRSSRPVIAVQITLPPLISCRPPAIRPTQVLLPHSMTHGHLPAMMGSSYE